MNISNLSSLALLKLTSEIKSQLKSRGVIRTNNVLGDYAESLVCNSLNLKMESSSTKGIDATGADGKTYQIKARMGSRGTVPTIKSLRSFDFDYLVLIIFNEDYSVKFSGKLSSALAKEWAIHNPRVNGFRLTISKALLNDNRIEPVKMVQLD